MKFLPRFLILFLTSSFQVAAGERTFGDGTLPVFLRQFDTNGDLRIDEEERQAIRDLRAKMREQRRSSIDRNNDGEISAGEIQAARKELRTRIEERRLAKFHEIAGEDGLISPAEYGTIPGIDHLPGFIFEAIFARLDTDGSGEVSAEEFLRKLRNHADDQSE